MPNKPKLEFATNVPVTAVFRKMFLEKPAPPDNPEWGSSFCWDVFHDGVEKIFFAKEGLNEKLSAYPPGSTLVVTLKEEKNPVTKKPFKTWDVREAILDDAGRAVKAPKESIHENNGEYIAFRKKRREMLADCIADTVTAIEVAMAESSAPLTFDAESIQKIATSLYIEYSKKP